jgi:two-component system response regulator QseB
MEGHYVRLLVIEDETELAKAVARGLKSLGYAVDIAFDAIDGEQMATAVNYDLIILDLNLPGKDGIEVCRYIRENGCTAAVLMLTARNKVSDRTLGLDSGADDYLAKPFAFDELRARIQALLRRTFGHRNPVLTIGGLTVNPATRTVSYCNKDIDLTAREFDILEYFACRYPAVISTEEILEHVWNDEVDPFSNVVRVHLANLRRKLKTGSGEPLIETLIGKGYRLCER